MSTSECSCRLCPTPGMYDVTSIPFVSRTRATLRRAEFGFFGVCVKTRTQTPRFCGLSCSAGLFVFETIFLRPLRTSWLIVGTSTPSVGARHRHPETRLVPIAGPGPRRLRRPENCSRPRNDAGPKTVRRFGAWKPAYPISCVRVVRRTRVRKSGPAVLRKRHAASFQDGTELDRVS